MECKHCPPIFTCLYAFLGSGDMDGLNKVKLYNPTFFKQLFSGFFGYEINSLMLFLSQNSPNNLSGMSNPPGTPRDDGELSGNFLHSFQSENVSPLPSANWHLCGDGLTRHSWSSFNGVEAQCCAPYREDLLAADWHHWLQWRKQQWYWAFWLKPVVVTCVCAYVCYIPYLHTGSVSP